jgi:hypothetical protein
MGLFTFDGRLVRSTRVPPFGPQAEWYWKVRPCLGCRAKILKRREVRTGSDGAEGAVEAWIDVLHESHCKFLAASAPKKK